MYKTKIFNEYCAENKLAEFLNENKISREQIISISMSSDSEAHRRLGSYGVDHILLVWDDGTIYKTQKEREGEREQLHRDWELQRKQAEEARAQLQKSLAELQASLEKS